MRGLNDGDVGLCMASAEGCEDMRKFAASKKAGTQSPCVIRPTAYCFGITLDNTWHRRCTPTPEECEFTLGIYRKNPRAERRRLGTCQLTRNINPLDAADASAVVRDR